MGSVVRHAAEGHACQIDAGHAAGAPSGLDGGGRSAIVGNEYDWRQRVLRSQPVSTSVLGFGFQSTNACKLPLRWRRTETRPGPSCLQQGNGVLNARSAVARTAHSTPGGAVDRRRRQKQKKPTVAGDDMVPGWASCLPSSTDELFVLLYQQWPVRRVDLLIPDLSDTINIRRVKGTRTAYMISQRSIPLQLITKQAPSQGL